MMLELDVDMKDQALTAWKQSEVEAMQDYRLRIAHGYILVCS